MNPSTTKNKLFPILRGIAVLAVCLGIWQLLALAVSNSYFLPDVAETAAALIKLAGKGDFYLKIFISLLRVAAGLIIGIVCGVLLGTVSYLLPSAHAFVSPIISVMKATPIAAIILILWFTFTDASLAIFVVFLMVTPVIWQTVYDGFKAIPTELREVCEAYEVSFVTKLRILVIPTVMRYFIPATVTSIGLAWKAEIAAEIMTYSNIGRSIQDFKTLSYDTASVFAWASAIIAMSMILEYVAKLLIRRIRL